MRTLMSVVILSAVAVPCCAETILKSEPLALSPYEVAYVHDAACPAGKVLKVTGTIRGLPRKRECVTRPAGLPSEQASLAIATP